MENFKRLNWLLEDEASEMHDFSAFLLEGFSSSAFSSAASLVRATTAPCHPQSLLCEESISPCRKERISLAPGFDSLSGTL